MFCICINDLLYFISQGLTISGLLLASISGLKTSNREIIESVYKLQNSPFTDMRGDDVFVHCSDIREEKIEEAIREKVKFVFCFIFSFVGITIDVIYDISNPSILIYRVIGTVISTLLFYLLCNGIKNMYVRYKKKKVIANIRSGFKIEIEKGDLIN